MSRYYFDLYNGDGPTSDEEGLDLHSHEAITNEVHRILVDIAREEIAGRERGAIAVNVRDEAGRTVFTGNLSFATEWHRTP
ncbi:MAG: hypothetical protein QHC90_04170 [Shinella sp.]|nr:hypothetical protein [Shinella sp.]